MNDENMHVFSQAIGSAKNVAEVLPQGYNLADVYLQLRQPGYAAETLRITARSLQRLAEQTAEIAVKLTGQH